MARVRRRVLVYELNEVPWTVVDRYVSYRPSSNLARLLPQAALRTTIDDDPVLLMPWRTWPTFHTSLLTEDHNAYDQGQDPASMHGTPLWDAAEDAGLSVGLFGLLQTWPPRLFRSGGFFVPDCFARTPATFPASLERFQKFNTAMTSENSFAAERDFSARELAGVAFDSVRHGLTPWTIAKGIEHVVRERTDSRYKTRRPAAQVLLCFDMFWQLHLEHQPDLSMFFTNHVASMMHRFWGDWFPGYAEVEAYQADDVYEGSIVYAMDLFDRGLGRAMRWVDHTPGAVLNLSSCIGQGPIPYRDMACTYVVDDVDRLIKALNLADAQDGIAMYPRLTLLFADHDAAAQAIGTIQSPVTSMGPLFRDIRLIGASVSFEIAFELDIQQLPEEVTWTPFQGKASHGDIDSLGISVRGRPGGGNTAQHTPEGIFITYGDGIVPDASRDEFNILDAAPSLLDLLGVVAPPSMKGRASVVC